MLRSSLILFVIGVAMMSASVYMNLLLEFSDSVIKRIMAEGLVVASWVSLWEALAGMLLNWQPAARERLIYRRLKYAELTFINQPTNGAAEGTGPSPS
jgi:hypothetical protein